MVKYLKLTRVSAYHEDGYVYVSIWQILKFYQITTNGKFTRIHLSDGTYVDVTETAEEIFELLGRCEIV